MLSKHIKNKSKGFTLVELIIVIVVIAILAAIAIPALSAFIDDANRGKALANGRTAFTAASVISAKVISDNGGILPSPVPAITASQIAPYLGFEPATPFTATIGTNGALSAFKYTEGKFSVDLDAASGSLKVTAS
jgi:type IV pilus assembly protein PilA